MEPSDMIDDFAEFDADCAVRLRVFDDWSKRSAQGGQQGGGRAFEEFIAVHPLMAERAAMESRGLPSGRS